MSAMMQTVIELRRVVQALAHGLPHPLWGVVLFGSTAREEATETSDLDLLVVADSFPEAFTERLRLLRSLVPAPLRGRVSLVGKTRAEFETSFPLPPSARRRLPGGGRGRSEAQALALRRPGNARGSSGSVSHRVDAVAARRDALASQADQIAYDVAAWGGR